MNIYSIRTTVQSEFAIVDFSRDPKGISNYFIHGRGDLRDLSIPLKAVAQSGYTKSNIQATDYIAASIRVPIFSTRFQDVLGEKFSGELEFVPCVIACDGQPFQFSAGRILRSLPLIDTEKSQYRKLASGASLLLRAVYRSEIESKFFICRDNDSHGRFVVSEAFKTLCEAHDFSIEFGSPV
ncbi:hypothetical protein [Burkholderia sp. BCC1993]|uniref:hypothetical protein n=1 Tax=Burkholderia sp. BCC1993 TaxID=2817444 RepID=UPI002AB14F18|nr:hypothetical protein [Burkholderia sp. BCC1993]